MVSMRIEFTWPRAERYRAEYMEPVKGPTIISPKAEVSGWVIRSEGDLTWKNPLEKFDRMFSYLAKSDASHASHLEFAKQYGLLTQKKENSFEPLSDFESAISSVKWIIDAGNSARIIEQNLKTAINLTANLSYIKSLGRHVLVLEPLNLLHAIGLQCAQSISSGNNIKSCKNCGGFFESGPAASRRADAIFCSEVCKDRHKSLLRSKKKEA